MNPFKNIILNMQASGPAAIICVWIISVTLLGFFGGDGSLAKSAMAALQVAGGFILASMAARA